MTIISWLCNVMLSAILVAVACLKLLSEYRSSYTFGPVLHYSVGVGELLAGVGILCSNTLRTPILYALVVAIVLAISHTFAYPTTHCGCFGETVILVPWQRIMLLCTMGAMGAVAIRASVDRRHSS